MKKICSLEKFIPEVEAVSKKWGLWAKSTIHPWFRGQTNSNWNLVSSIYRKSSSYTYEREMVRDFKLRASAFQHGTDILDLPNNELEWLFMMQHYCMPTRLLDWTENHLVSLFFAVEDLDDSVDGCVWVLGPWSLNMVTVSLESVPISSHPIFKKYTLSGEQFHPKISASLPAAIRPIKNTSRIVAQNGTFIIQGASREGVDLMASKHNENNDCSIDIEKIMIDGKAKKKIIKQLYLAGISPATLFPGLEGLSKEISFRYSEQYMRIN